MSSSATPSPASPGQNGGFLVTLRAVVHAAILAGFFLGILDFVLIASVYGLPGGVLSALGCLVGGIAVYVLGMLLLMLLASPLDAPAPSIARTQHRASRIEEGWIVRSTGTGTVTLGSAE